MLTHDAVRQTMLRRRRRIPYGAQLRASHSLATNIVKTAVYQQSQHIAFYWAVAGEISVQTVLKQAWKDQKTCYLPVIDDKTLVFVNVTPATRMELNRFSIPEPTAGGLIVPPALDLVLTPLVAFDRQCHRIGMGGGFYDRTFAVCKNTVHHRPFMMGVAHYCQQTSAITPASWDITLDSVVTDRYPMSDIKKPVLL